MERSRNVNPIMLKGDVMNEQNTLNLLNRMLNDMKQFKEYFSGEYSLKVLKEGERERMLSQHKELQDSYGILEQNFKNREEELKLKYSRSEEEYKAKLGTLAAQISELDLRKANLVADIEVLKLNKLKMIDSVNEIKAERSMKKAANV